MVEANFDGLVGPTHNYGGLSYGNVASLSFKSDKSSPKQAALQGLKKAKALFDLGIPQGIVPPQVRPNISALKNLGFTGTDEQILQQAASKNPGLLSLCSSSSFMWTANAATVAPSADTLDAKVHLTPANLLAKPHRAIEHEQTFKTLKGIFSDKNYFSVHPALQLGDAFSDEGAANHTRLEDPSGQNAVHFFVYGREAMNSEAPKPLKYPARQTLEASQAIAFVNKVKPERCVFAQQNPEVIDAGVFHNDVISVGHKNVLLYHEKAFLNTDKTLEELNQKLSGNLIAVLVKDSEVSVNQAVTSYLFNSQLVSIGNNQMAIIAPEHCQKDPDVKKCVETIISDESNPISKVHYFDLLQSMKNGGGPACLRLRVALTEKELAAVNQQCLLTEAKYEQLVLWVNKHYREELSLQDLADPIFIGETKQALGELSVLLNLPNIY